jgi:hypothetical protein
MQIALWTQISCGLQRKIECAALALGLPSPVKNGNSKVNLLQATGIGCLKGGTKPKKVHPNHIEISKVPIVD